ncbi:MAG: hypothetical protein HF307_11825 [Ignavibacteria bacterium]|nr:hypothetical protein [Ignavibacteria bacterium]
MRQKILEECGIHLSIDILRYEDIKSCLELVKKKVAASKPDFLLFHMRAEPVLPKVKFYNVYTDSKGRLKRSIRIFTKVVIRIAGGEKISKRVVPEKSLGKFHNCLRELNYLLGILAFNFIKMKKDHLELIKEITGYCKAKDIEPIITGPVSRPRSYFENLISEKIYEFAGRHTGKTQEQCLNLLGLEDEKGEFLFCKDLIKVNEAGHKRIAEMIFEQMLQMCAFRRVI